MHTLKIFFKRNSFFKKLNQIHWSIIFIISLIVSIGLAMQYSAAKGNFYPWANKQFFHFLLGIAILFTIAVINIKFWLRYSYIIYLISLISLITVEILGSKIMGAQRWVNLYFINVQPSELMKIALVLALARYFHYLTEKEIQLSRYFIPPIILTLLPALLVLRQPDLGTAIILGAIGLILIFLAGIKKWIIFLSSIIVICSMPLLWYYLHDYQKNRILTFLNPERDPLGAGYHILQSKIALGSGGITGKGFLQGSQSYLNFLPEKQTDFIFTMYSEEFGIIGGLFLLFLYFILFLYGYSRCCNSKTRFGRLSTIGFTSILFLYVFINIAMVTGIIPVVGVPLPLVSYGGASMITILSGFGFIMSESIHNKNRYLS